MEHKFENYLTILPAEGVSGALWSETSSGNCVGEYDCAGIGCYGTSPGRYAREYHWAGTK